MQNVIMEYNNTNHNKEETNIMPIVEKQKGQHRPGGAFDAALQMPGPEMASNTLPKDYSEALGRTTRKIVYWPLMLALASAVGCTPFYHDKGGNMVRRATGGIVCVAPGPMPAVQSQDQVTAPSRAMLQAQAQQEWQERARVYQKCVTHYDHSQGHARPKKLYNAKVPSITKDVVASVALKQQGVRGDQRAAARDSASAKRAMTHARRAWQDNHETIRYWAKHHKHANIKVAASANSNAAGKGAASTNDKTHKRRTVRRRSPRKNSKKKTGSDEFSLFFLEPFLRVLLGPLYRLGGGGCSPAKSVTKL